MRHIPLWAGAIPLFAAASAHAQFITPVEGTRSVTATLSATDPVTNVVDSDTRRTEGFADFNESLLLKANTQYEDSPSRVDANGSGTENSRITGSRITASLSATAEGISMDSAARGYATGNADFYLTFQLSRFARYVVAGDARADSDASWGSYSFGGSTALVHIAHFNGGLPILSIDIGNTDSDSVRRKGWLAAGAYRLQGDVSALVDARDSFAGTASAWWSADVQFFCAADYNVNGAVTTTDRDAFLQAWNARSLDADVDGNGVVDAADRTAYLSAFNAGC